MAKSPRVIEVSYLSSFKKDLSKTPKPILDDIEAAIQELLDGKLRQGRKLKRLKGTNSIYSIRLGKSHRLSFEIVGTKAIIRRVGPRQNFYNNY